MSIIRPRYYSFFVLSGVSLQVAQTREAAHLLPEWQKNITNSNGRTDWLWYVKIGQQQLQAIPESTGCPTRVYARAFVCGLLQSHRSPRRTVSSARRQHAATTHPPGWPFSPSVPLTSDVSGTCSSTWTSQNLSSSERQISWVLWRHPYHLRPWQELTCQLPKRLKCWKSCLISVWRFTSTSRRWHDHATTMHRPSGTFDNCWLRNWHRRWCVDWFYPGSTIAMLCCTALQAIASRSYSVRRTTQLVCSDRSLCAKTIPSQPVIEDVTLAARSAENQVQSGSAKAPSTPATMSKQRSTLSKQHSTLLKESFNLWRSLCCFDIVASMDGA